MNILNTAQNRDFGLLVNRITISLLILFHGVANTSTNFAGVKGALSSNGLPEFLSYGVFVGEIVAPILIIIGYRAKLGGVIFAFDMLMAIFIGHASEIFSLNQYGGWALEVQGLYLFGALTVFFTGAGKYSISTKSKWD